jgi:hypothetical protein
MKNLGLHSGPVLQIIASEMMYHKKARVFPSHKRILNELKIKFREVRCPRTLMRWMKRAESHGLITRTKRHRYTPQNGWEFRSSLYGITMLGWYLLVKGGYFTWKQIRGLWEEVKANFRKPKKNRKVFRPSGELTSIGEIFGGARPDTS